MEDYNSLRSDLEAAGQSVEVSDSLFEALMELQLRFERDACKIEYHLGRPTVSFGDAHRKVFSINKDWDKFIPLMRELLDLVQQEMVEEGTPDLITEELARYRAVLDVLETSTVDAERDEAIEEGKRAHQSVMEKTSAERGLLDATTAVVLGQEAGVNQTLLAFALDKTTKGQVVRLQQLCANRPADDAELAAAATKILLEVDGARAVLETAVAQATAEASAAQAATEIVLQDSPRGRFIYMLGKLDRPGLTDALFTLATYFAEDHPRDGFTQPSDLDIEGDGQNSPEGILFRYGIIDEGANFVDDSEAEIRTLCLTAIADWKAGVIVHPDSGESLYTAT